MKHLFRCAAAWLLAFPLWAQPMTPPERQELKQLLQTSEQQVKQAVKNLTTEQLTYKPGADRWSVQEVLEHITVTEQTLIASVQQMMAAPLASDSLKAKRNPMTTQQMQTMVVADRANKRQAPDIFRPTGRFADSKAMVQAFATQRKSLDTYLKTPGLDVHGHLTSTPAGVVDGYQYLVFMVAHTNRHLVQLNEVKAEAQFPLAAEGKDKAKDKAPKEKKGR